MRKMNDLSMAFLYRRVLLKDIPYILYYMIMTKGIVYGIIFRKQLHPVYVGKGPGMGEKPL